jgi:hypothetical protein
MQKARKWSPTMPKGEHSDQDGSIVIESGIAVPKQISKTHYPWAHMEKGDSFAVEVRSGETAKDVVRKLYVSGRAWCKKHRPTMSVVARREDDDNRVRVWMVEA